MADPEAPVEDVLEQEEPAGGPVGGAAGEVPGEEAGQELGDDVPEADAMEQSTPVRAEDALLGESGLPEGVNEADAAEQAHVVEYDDDYDW